MSRRLKILVALCLVLALLTGALPWALPEIVRRVAVGKLTELSGRQTSIERVELNLFTGRFAVNRLRMARRPGHGPEAFVEFDRLAGRVALPALFGFDISLAELSLARPAVRITRTGPADFDFADLLQLFTAPVVDARPSRFTFSLGRLVGHGRARWSWTTRSSRLASSGASSRSTSKPPGSRRSAISRPAASG